MLNSEEKLKCTIYYISVGCFHLLVEVSTFAAENRLFNPSCVRVSMEESCNTSALLTTLGKDERNCLAD